MTPEPNPVMVMGEGTPSRGTSRWAVTDAHRFGNGFLFQVATAPEEAVALIEAGQGRVPSGAATAEALVEDWTSEPTPPREA